MCMTLMGGAGAGSMGDTGGVQRLAKGAPGGVLAFMARNAVGTA